MNLVSQLLAELGTMLALLIQVASGPKTIRVARIVTRRLTDAARVAFAWPFFLFAAAMLGYGFAQIVVPVLTIILLVIAFWVMTARWPIGILATEAALSTRIPILGKFVEKAREVTRALLIVLGIEILTGIYLSVVPIANDRLLALVLILVMAAIVCFVGAGKKSHVPTATPTTPQGSPARVSRPLTDYVVWGLVAAACVITLIFFLGGRNSLGKVISSVSDPFANHGTSSRTFLPKPPAGRPMSVRPGAGNGQSEKRMAREKKPKEKGGGGKGETSHSPTPPPPPPDVDLSGIAPNLGDSGPIMMRVKDCWPSTGELTCEGFVLDRDTESQGRVFYLMDSDGTVQVADEGRNFDVRTFGGSIRFVGGGNMKILSPGVKTSFVFEFAEPKSGASEVAVNLHFMGADAINHFETFTNVPVVDRY